MAKSFYGLIGKPLTHSFSPGFFGELFRREGIDARYDLFPLASIDDFPALLRDHPELQGLNVTLPYKTAVLPFLDQVSEAAQEIGAVNCIRIDNGRCTGYNTDWAAFTDSLKPLLKPYHRRALILGNGGAAKAVAFGLKQLDIPFRIVSRGQDGNTLSYGDITPLLLREHLVLIQTTPLGMHPDEGRAPQLPYAQLTPRHLLYDLIYNPAHTRFLELGEERGAATKNGLEMLHLQAGASWRIWNQL